MQLKNYNYQCSKVKTSRKLRPAFSVKHLLINRNHHQSKAYSLHPRQHQALKALAYLVIKAIVFSAVKALNLKQLTNLRQVYLDHSLKSQVAFLAGLQHQPRFLVSHRNKMTKNSQFSTSHQPPYLAHSHLKLKPTKRKSQQLSFLK